MKRIAIILAVLVFGAATFTAGMYTGTRRAEVSGLLSSGERSVLRAMLVLKELDRNDLANARVSLNNAIDAGVLEIRGYREIGATAQDQKAAAETLGCIAHYRKTHPFLGDSNTPAVRKIVQQILDSASGSCQHQRDSKGSTR